MQLGRGDPEETRYFTESAARLARKAAEADQILGVHGVSVTAGVAKGDASAANRAEVERVFPVHETPTRADRLYRTVELPRPVTQEGADRFKELFGRG
jgi:hypothetical protein